MCAVCEVVEVPMKGMKCLTCADVAVAEWAKKNRAMKLKPKGARHQPA